MAKRKKATIVATENRPERIIVCRPGDPRLMQKWDQWGGFERYPRDGVDTLFVVIGANSGGTVCAQAASRRGLPYGRLFAFAHTSTPSSFVA